MHCRASREWHPGSGVEEDERTCGEMALLECWASEISQCHGRQSGEHYFSKCLWEGTVLTVEAPFTKGVAIELPLSSLKANVLCEGHNNQLSPVDAEAQRFKENMSRWENQIDVSDSEEIWTGAREVRLSGVLFGRWLSKVYCNLMQMNRRDVPKDFQMFTFGLSTNTRIQVLLHVYEGMTVDTRQDRIRCFDFFNEHGEVGLCVRFFGFEWIVTNAMRFRTWTHIDFGDGRILPASQFMDRPRQISFGSSLGHGLSSTSVRVKIDWGTEDAA